MRLNFHSIAAVAVCATLLGPVQPAPESARAQAPDSLRLNATYGFVRSWNLAASLYAIDPASQDAKYDFQDYSCAYRLSFIIMKCLHTAEAELEPLQETLDAALTEAAPDPEVHQLASWCLQELQNAESHRVKLLKAFQSLEKEEAEFNSDKDPYEAGDTMVGTIAYSLEQKLPLAGLVKKAKALVESTAFTEPTALTIQQSLRLRFAECYAAGYALASALSEMQYAAEIILGNAEEFCVYTEIFLARDLLVQTTNELGMLTKFMTDAESMLVRDAASLDLASACLTNVESAAQRRAALLQSWTAMHEAAENHHTKNMFSVVLEDLKSKCDIAPALKQSKALVQGMKAL